MTADNTTAGLSECVAALRELTAEMTRRGDAHKYPELIRAADTAVVRAAGALSAPAPAPASDAATSLPRHKFWGAGEPDCPQDLKAPNGELHTMRCKVCGDGWRKSSDVCFAALSTSAAPAVQQTDMVLVPRAATEEMVHAGRLGWAYGIPHAWAEMLAAAPAAPSPQAEQDSKDAARLSIPMPGDTPAEQFKAALHTALVLVDRLHHQIDALAATPDTTHGRSA